MPERTIFMSNNLSPPQEDRDKESRRQTEEQYCCGLRQRGLWFASRCFLS